MKIRYRRDLWNLIKDLKGNAAEVGVAEGYFSADILRWPIDIPIVYMVDRWSTNLQQTGDGGFPQDWHDRNFAAAQARVKEFGDRAVILRGDSVEMAKHVPDSTLIFVSIDADHSFQAVMRDIHAWYPKVMSGGVMAFHDYEATQYGVKKAVNLFALNKNLQVEKLPEDKIADAGAYFIC